MRRDTGFGLVEALLALSLGVLLVLAGSRLFIGALQGWQAMLPRRADSTSGSLGCIAICSSRPIRFR